MGVKCAALLPHPPIAVEEIGGRELKKAEKMMLKKWWLISFKITSCCEF